MVVLYTSSVQEHIDTLSVWSFPLNNMITSRKRPPPCVQDHLPVYKRGPECLVTCTCYVYVPFVYHVIYCMPTFSSLNSTAQFVPCMSNSV